MKTNEENNIYSFWNRIDSLVDNLGTTLKDLCEKAEINYGSMRRQRTSMIYPGTSEVVRIAKTLNTTIDYLLTGEDSHPLSAEAQAVESDPKLRLLVNTLMNDPTLLEIVSTVNSSARNVEAEKSGA